jgi:hypothetical protein
MREKKLKGRMKQRKERLRFCAVSLTFMLLHCRQKPTITGLITLYKFTNYFHCTSLNIPNIEIYLK